MITCGLDLAAQDERTATCAIDWSSSGAAVERLVVGVSDELAVDMMGAAEWSGIDSPFGWPGAFVDAVRRHAGAGRWPEATTRELRFRVTDLAIHDATGLWPLSVSSDRIAVPAWRCARLLDRLGEAQPLDRAGGDGVVEVYPAGALKTWGLSSRGYKNRSVAKREASDEARSALFAELLQRIDRLHLTEEIRALAIANDDAFDALVCALVARAAALGLTTGPAPDQLEVARIEGWIHLPTPGSLERLTDLSR